MAARRTSKSTGKRRRSSTGRRRAGSSSKKRTASGRKPIKVTHPGALKRAGKKGETTVQTAKRLQKSGTPAQKRRANLYLNVFRPATRKRTKRKGR